MIGIKIKRKDGSDMMWQINADFNLTGYQEAKYHEKRLNRKKNVIEILFGVRKTI